MQNSGNQEDEVWLVEIAYDTIKAFMDQVDHAETLDMKKKFVNRVRSTFGVARRDARLEGREMNVHIVLVCIITEVRNCDLGFHVKVSKILENEADIKSSIRRTAIRSAEIWLKIFQSSFINPVNLSHKVIIANKREEGLCEVARAKCARRLYIDGSSQKKLDAFLKSARDLLPSDCALIGILKGSKAIDAHLRHSGKPALSATQSILRWFSHPSPPPPHAPTSPPHAPQALLSSSSSPSSSFSSFSLRDSADSLSHLATPDRSQSLPHSQTHATPLTSDSANAPHTAQGLPGPAGGGGGGGAAEIGRAVSVAVALLPHPQNNRPPPHLPHGAVGRKREEGRVAMLDGSEGQEVVAGRAGSSSSWTARLFGRAPPKEARMQLVNYGEGRGRGGGVVGEEEWRRLRMHNCEMQLEVDRLNRALHDKGWGGDGEARKYGRREKEVERLQRMVLAEERLGGGSRPPVAVCQVSILYSKEELSRATAGFSAQRQLGAGSFGEVFRATTDGRQVAVKRLRQVANRDVRRAYENELKVHRSLCHGNVVRLLGSCEEGGEHFLVTELMENGSLYDRLRCVGQTAPLPWHTRFKIFEGAVEGLLYLHQRNPPIVHRDVKPANILLGAEFEARLGDVGLAKPLELLPDASCAHSSTCVGTNVYVDPDFWRHGTYSTASDVYSLGVVLLELLGGVGRSIETIWNAAEEVREGREPEGSFLKVLDESAGAWPPGVGLDLLWLASKCWTYRRDGRLPLTLVRQKLREMRAAVEKGMEEERAAEHDFLCPITRETMRDPVVALDGYKYERQAIQKWFQKSLTSPMTNAVLDSELLIPDHTLRSQIQTRRERVS